MPAEECSPAPYAARVSQKAPERGHPRPAARGHEVVTLTCVPWRPRMGASRCSMIVFDVSRQWRSRWSLLDSPILTGLFSFLKAGRVPFGDTHAHLELVPKRWIRGPYTSTLVMPHCETGAPSHRKSRGGWMKWCSLCPCSEHPCVLWQARQAYRSYQEGILVLEDTLLLCFVFAMYFLVVYLNVAATIGRACCHFLMDTTNSPFATILAPHPDPPRPSAQTTASWRPVGLPRRPELCRRRQYRHGRRCACSC